MKVTRIFIDETISAERQKELDEKQKEMEEIMGKNPLLSNAFTDLFPFSKNYPKTLKIDIVDTEIIAIGEPETASDEIREKFKVEKFKRIWVTGQPMWFIKA